VWPDLDRSRNARSANVHGGGDVVHSIQLTEMNPSAPTRALAARNSATGAAKRHGGEGTLASLAAVTDTTREGAAAAWRPGVPRRGALAGALAAVLLLAAVLALALRGGSHHPTAAARAGAPGAARAGAPRSARPAPAGASAATGAAGASVATARPGVSEIRDPQEASSYPAPASVHHSAAATPSKAGEAIVAPGALSDAEVRAQLKQMEAAERSAQQLQRQRLAPVPGGNSIGGDGTIPITASVPEVVQKVIAGANAIADFPYVFGGGHASFVDNAYDCSGSVSYALAAGGLLNAPLTSGELESWGAPGPGRYITVLANPGHTFMYVNGIMYNTAGRSGVYASRWQVASASSAGFVARHWPGL
jgi:cell wall-associated NlpC family hydrolase